MNPDFIFLLIFSFIIGWFLYNMVAENSGWGSFGVVPILILVVMAIVGIFRLE